MISYYDADPNRSYTEDFLCRFDSYPDIHSAPAPEGLTCEDIPSETDKRISLLWYEILGVSLSEETLERRSNGR